MTRTKKRETAAPGGIVDAGDLHDPWTILDELYAGINEQIAALDGLAATLGPRPAVVATTAELVPVEAAEISAPGPRAPRGGSTLSPDVRAILEQSEFADGVLRLPPAQLDRKLYEAVNKALGALGGKWNKKAQGHVFAKDAADALAQMLASGIVPPTNPDAFFPTPPAVVEAMLALAGPLHGKGVLEPSAGTGAIAVAIRRAAPDCLLTIVEKDADRAKHLHALDVTKLLIVGDFLSVDWWAPQCFDAILMNPPFAVEGDASAWMTHVRHAVGLLAPGGVLVSVVPSGYEHRADRKHVEFRAEIADRARYQALPDDSFKSSGTGVNCGLLTIGGGA